KNRNRGDTMTEEMFKQTLGTDEELVTKKLEQWAREISDKTFIYYGEEKKTYTFKVFNELANSFAHNLIDHGIQKGGSHFIFLKKSVSNNDCHVRNLESRCSLLPD